MAVFWAGADQRDDAVGCICLRAQCTNDWPLKESDAETFYGYAACTTLRSATALGFGAERSRMVLNVAASRTIGQRQGVNCVAFDVG